MKNITLVPVTILLSLFLTACQDEATTTTPTADIQSFTDASLSTPQIGDIHVTEVEAPQLPPINTNKAFISFISVPAEKLNITPPTNMHVSTSDEYWTTVSGAELNNGIKLSISQAASVIRVSPRADTSSGALIHSDTIAPDNIQLFNLDHQSAVNKSSSYIHSMADPDELATAGLTDGSSALTMSASAKPGQYQLKVSQPLSAGSSYLVNVKEKHSPYQLSLRNQYNLSSQSKTLNFDLSLTNSDEKLTPQASWKHSSGQHLSLNVTSINGQWQATLPNGLPMPTSNAGLSEIQIDIQTKVNGLDVVRTVKTAFKQFVPSAKFEKQVKTRWQGGVPEDITLTLSIAKPGRFAVSAYLTGTDANGQDQSILKTESANWLSMDDSTISLKLDTQLITQSGLTPPFKLQRLTLNDQGQMARLSYQQDALSLSR